MFCHTGGAGRPDQSALGAAGGAHPSLQSWHCEWVQRQNHALLAVMRMYCQTLPRALLTPELKSDMLLDGAAAAAATRQAISPAVRSADPDVVLDTSSVTDGPWLGSLVQTTGSQPRCAPTLLSFALPLHADAAVHAARHGLFCGCFRGRGESNDVRSGVWLGGCA